MTPIPTEFPSDDPLVQAQVTVSQVKSVVALNVDALKAMRAKYPLAMQEASVEGQMIAAAESAMTLLLKFI